jgi:tetratricopeptide (TPR) repeat protein
MENFGQARIHIMANLKSAEANGFKFQQAEALWLLSKVDLQENQLEDALAHLEAVLPMWKAIKQSGEIADETIEGYLYDTQITIAYASIEVAILDRTGEHYEHALQSYQRAQAIYQELADHSGVAQVLNEIGTIYHNHSLYSDAQRTWTQALEECQQAQHVGCEIAVRNNLGELHDSLGYYNKALTQHEAALALCQTDDSCVESKTDIEHNIGRDNLNLGKYADALAHLKVALGLARQQANQEREASILNTLANLSTKRADYPDALAKFNEAASIFLQLGHLEGQGATAGNIGEVYQQQGHLSEALAQYQKALALAQQANDLVGQATAIGNIGGVYEEMGRYEEALRQHLAALTAWQATGILDGEATERNNIGAVYDDLGRYTEALTHYEKALDLHRQSGRRSGEISTLNNQAVALHHRGDDAEALPILQEVLALAEEDGLQALVATVLDNIGATYFRLHQDKEALTNHQAALALRKQIGDRAGEGKSLLNLGAVYVALKEYDQAQAHFTHALAIFSKTDFPFERAQTLSSFARMYQQQGKLSKAIVYYKWALRTAETIQEKISVEEFGLSFQASRAAWYRQLIDTLITAGDFSLVQPGGNKSMIVMLSGAKHPALPPRMLHCVQHDIIPDPFRPTCTSL